MGRKKSIDRETTMKAIESVVRRQGLAGLSIDAVAKEAGISKSSVVYDFRNKAELLDAFIRDRVSFKRGIIGEAAEAHDCKGTGEAWLRGLLDTMTEAPSEEEMSIAMIIAAGMGGYGSCRATMCDAVTADLDVIAKDAANPLRNCTVYLAIYGLMSLEYFGFHQFSAETRMAILDDIARLLPDTSDPDAAAPEPAVPDKAPDKNPAART